MINYSTLAYITINWDMVMSANIFSQYADIVWL